MAEPIAFQSDPMVESSYNPPVAMVPSGGCIHSGISLRDHFAARAVAGVVANSEAVHVGADPTLSRLALDEARAAACIAEHAYAIADAMLAERQKPIRPALDAATSPARRRPGGTEG